MLLCKFLIMYIAVTYIKSRSKRSGWSGFGRTTISEGKTKTPFYKKQVINKSTGVIFGLVQFVIL